VSMIMVTSQPEPAALAEGEGRRARPLFPLHRPVVQLRGARRVRPYETMTEVAGALAQMERECIVRSVLETCVAAFNRLGVARTTQRQDAEDEDPHL